PRKKYRPKSCGRRLAPPKEAIRKNATLKRDRFFENATQNGPAPEKIPPLEKRSIGKKSLFFS
ncbi:MAG: hypothetical protein LBP95_06795, partial [Deltaproteobacteria bacterium]|nr:hypothetical protein [Deltaproteobacteria bacterium]